MSIEGQGHFLTLDGSGELIIMLESLLPNSTMYDRLITNIASCFLFFYLTTFLLYFSRGGGGGGVRVGKGLNLDSSFRILNSSSHLNKQLNA